MSQKIGASAPLTPEVPNPAQELIDSHRRFFTTFAQDISVRFRIGEDNAFDPQTGMIYLKDSLFSEGKITGPQGIWICFHELSHCKDLANDPTGGKDYYTYLDKKGAEFAEIINQHRRQKTGVEPTEVQKDGALQTPQQLHK